MGKTPPSMLALCHFMSEYIMLTLHQQEWDLAQLRMPTQHDEAWKVIPLSYSSEQFDKGGRGRGAPYIHNVFCPYMGEYKYIVDSLPTGVRASCPIKNANPTRRGQPLLGTDWWWRPMPSRSVPTPRHSAMVSPTDIMFSSPPNLDSESESSVSIP